MGSRDPRGTRACAARPRQRGAVRLRRVRSGENQRVVGVAGAELPQPLDCTRQSELSAAEPFDEVAAATGADRLERAELPVDGPVPAGDALASDAVADDDPLPFQQQLGERAAVDVAREEPSGE